MNKRINIYITQKECKTLNDMKYKYHVSISTIANTIFMHLNKKIGNQLFEDYLYTEKGYKTSIKPRSQTGTETRLSKPMTNAIKIYLHDDMTKYMTEKEAQKIKSQICNELNNTYEEMWNGNNMSRFIPKFIKQNPKYVRKLIEE